MSVHYSKSALREVATRAPASEAPRLSNRAERVFALHPALFGATIACYFAFLAIMAAVFMNPNLVIPFAIFVAYMVMYFAVPALWAKVAGRPVGRFQSWTEFRSEGMDILTGHIGSGGAIVQVLLVPAVVVGWAVAVALVAALV
jgi:hypothetical protein